MMLLLNSFPEVLGCRGLGGGWIALFFSGRKLESFLRNSFNCEYYIKNIESQAWK
jgi:hypothetical protein